MGRTEKRKSIGQTLVVLGVCALILRFLAWFLLFGISYLMDGEPIFFVVSMIFPFWDLLVLGSVFGRGLFAVLDILYVGGIILVILGQRRKK